MLRLFQNIRPASSLLVFIAGLAIRLPFLISGKGYSSDLSLNMMNGFFSTINQNIYVAVIAGLVIVFLQSLLFNKLCIDHDVIYTHSYLPAYFFMMLNSVFPENIFINPIMLVNFFVLLSMLFIFRLYREENASVILFYSALFYGCASLILPVMYTGIIFLIIGTIIFKNITIKDILSIISGYTLPLLMLWGIQFLAGYSYIFPKVTYKFDFNLNSRIQTLVVVFYILAICSAGLLKTAINYTKNNIKTRRISLLMITNLAFSLTIILFKLNEYQFYFPLLTFALTLQFSYFLLGKKGRRGKEFLHYLLLAVIVYSLYGDQLLKLP